MNITGLEVAFGLSAVGMLFLALPLVGLVIDRRRHSAGLRAVAAREAETEPASQRPRDPRGAPRGARPAVRDLLLSDLPEGDRAHVLWASTLDQIPVVPAPGDTFGRHADAALALTRPEPSLRPAERRALADIEARLRAGLAALSLPAWAVI